ncbi:peptidase inhibitor family I36 protein [Wenjunlia tyrosinilytica]|uniref:Peptidase inhibitor family I36 n=1 Tax=Wenjunlia tyrosinilytica TaxID=1544741 RepID=A0A917ZCS2_9ACTN|nr:peptidase inhibitor family I36 protein [Wenjunlia tyrosinilytica]GGO80515.1 hypothetical protein GCM10012280_02610 [Wenjunlia tyrosinilytica]
MRRAIIAVLITTAALAATTTTAMTAPVTSAAARAARSGAPGGTQAAAAKGGGVAGTAHGRRAGAAAGATCDRGEFCAWTGLNHGGQRYTWDLSTAGIESCVPLPQGVSARSFANRIGRPVTTYQDRECGTEGEFDTYPGDGTWVPEAPYVVRAFQVWEN